jgi:hypothetical protein
VTKNSIIPSRHAGDDLALCYEVRQDAEYFEGISERTLAPAIYVRELPGAHEQHKFLLNPLKLEERVSGICREVETAPFVILDQGMGHKAVAALRRVIKYEPAANRSVRSER